VQINMNPPQKNITFYFVRHGETILNVLNRAQGWSDSVLTRQGEQNVRLTGRYLKDIPFSTIYSSDSHRATQTAKIILEENLNSSNLHLNVDKRLREFCFGSYEGSNSTNMKKQVFKYQKKIYRQLENVFLTLEEFSNTIAILDQMKNKEDIIWPAENHKMIKNRLSSFLKETTDQAVKKGNDKILIISHGLSIRALFNIFVQDVAIDYELDNASVSIMNYNKGLFSLEKANYISHIK